MNKLLDDTMVVTITEILNNINSKKIYPEKDEENDIFSDFLSWGVKKTVSDNVDNTSRQSLVISNPLNHTENLLKSTLQEKNITLESMVEKLQLKSILLPGLSTFILLAMTAIDIWVKIVVFATFIIHVIYMDVLNHSSNMNPNSFEKVTNNPVRNKYE